MITCAINADKEIILEGIVGNVSVELSLTGIVAASTVVVIKSVGGVGIGIMPGVYLSWIFLSGYACLGG